MPKPRPLRLGGKKTASKPAPIKETAKLAKGPVEVPEELKNLAETFYVNNEAMNAHKRTSEKARVALYTGMKEGKIPPFTHQIKSAVGMVNLSVSIGPGRPTTVVDPEKLFRAVLGDEYMNACMEEESFAALMSIVSIAKGAADGIYGTKLVETCSMVVSSAENVSVKKA